MSTAYDRVALHFTWNLAPAVVADGLVDLQRDLSPFAARPHWGKSSGRTPRQSALYERHADFVRLAERLEPRGAFRNAWLEDHLPTSSPRRFAQVDGPETASQLMPVPRRVRMCRVPPRTHLRCPGTPLTGCPGTLFVLGLLGRCDVREPKSKNSPEHLHDFTAVVAMPS